MQVRHVVSDSDGTLVSFNFWFGPAMLEIIPRLAAVLGVSAEEFGAEVGRNMIKDRTHESAFPFVGPYFASKWKGTHSQFVEQITEPFFQVVDATRDRYLTAYPGVKATFEQAASLGIKISILSDAPLYATLAKLKRLGLEGQVSGIYAMDTPNPPSNEIWNPEDFAFCRTRVDNYLLLGLAQQFVGIKVVPLPRHYEKPNTSGLELILRDFGLKPEEVLFIGDSYAKDGSIAEALGIGFICARYGVNDFAPPQYLEIINELLNPDKGKAFSWHAVDRQPPALAEVVTYSGLLPFLQRPPEPSSAYPRWLRWLLKCP